MNIKTTFAEYKVFIVVAFVALCGMLGTDIHLASLPSIAAFLGVGKSEIQLSVSIFLLGLGVSMLVYGPLSDKYGRKPIIIFGMLLAIVASFASVFSTDITYFLTTRLLQGIGSGVCMGLGRTVIADVMSLEQLAAIGSYLSIIISLSPLFAPALGGYIEHAFEWQINFVVLGLILGVALTLYVVICPETNLHKDKNAFSLKGLYTNYKYLLTHSTFVGSTLISGIAMAALMSYVTLSSFILQEQYHLSPIVYGWLTGLVGMGSLIGKFICPSIIKRRGISPTSMLGLWLMFGAGLWILGFYWLDSLNVSMIMVAVFASSMSMSLIIPGMMALAVGQHKDKRGLAGSLYGSFQMLIAFLASTLIGMIEFKGIILLGFTYVVLAAVGLWIYFTLIAKPRKD